MEVTFYNWSREDVTLSWDGEPYVVKAGELVTDFIRSVGGERLILQPGIIKTFAKQLGDRECNRLNLKPENVAQWEEIRSRATRPPTDYADQEEEPAERPEHLKHLDQAEKAAKKAAKPKKAKEPAPEPEAEAEEAAS